MDNFNPEPICKVINSPEGKLNGELLFEKILVNASKTLSTESCCQFNNNGELSLLGFINGILGELTNKVLVADVESGDKLNLTIKGFTIREKWW